MAGIQCGTHSESGVTRIGEYVLFRNPARFPDMLIQFHIQENAPGTTQIRRVLPFQPWKYNLEHLFLENALTLGADVFFSVFPYQRLDFIRLIKVKLKHSSLIPFVRPAEIVGRDQFAILEPRMEPGQHTPTVFRIAVWRQSHGFPFTIAMPPSDPLRDVAIKPTQ